MFICKAKILASARYNKGLCGHGVCSCGHIVIHSTRDIPCLEWRGRAALHNVSSYLHCTGVMYSGMLQEYPSLSTTTT